MKLTKIVLIAVLALTASAHAGDRDKAGNGGGIAEQNFAFAATNMANYLGSCKGNPACNLSAEETTLLDAILEELKSQPARLEFRSENEQPGFFKINLKDVRTAKTSLERGSMIFINSDLLYTEDENGKTAPTSMMAAVSLLAHELGHHQGVHDETKLDLFGAKIRMFLSKALYEAETPWGQSVLVLNLGDTFPGIAKVQVLAQDSLGYHDLTDNIMRAVAGASGAGPCSNTNAPGKWRLDAVSLDNIHRSRTTNGEGKDYWWVGFQSDVVVRCINGEGVRFSYLEMFQFRFVLKYDVKIKHGSLYPSSTKLNGSSLFGLIRCSSSEERSSGGHEFVCH